MSNNCSQRIRVHHIAERLSQVVSRELPSSSLWCQSTISGEMKVTPRSKTRMQNVWYSVKVVDLLHLTEVMVRTCRSRLSLQPSHLVHACRDPLAPGQTCHPRHLPCLNRSYNQNTLNSYSCTQPDQCAVTEAYYSSGSFCFWRFLKIFCYFVELRIDAIDFLLFLAPFAILHLDETEIASAFLSVPPISAVFSAPCLAQTDNVHFHLMIFIFFALLGIALMNRTQRIYPQVVTQQAPKDL